MWSWWKLSTPCPKFAQNSATITWTTSAWRVMTKMGMENSSFMAWSSQESVDSDGLFRCWRFVSKIHFCILSLIIYIFLFLFGVFCGLPPEFWIWNSSRFATVNGRSRKSDPLRWHFWSYSRTVEGARHWTGRDGRDGFDDFDAWGWANWCDCLGENLLVVW